MIELVVPDALNGHAQLDDDRLSLDREMVGRSLFSFDGSLDEALALAKELSEENRGDPVLVNNVRSETSQGRIVDVYMHQEGRQLSVSKGVERPQPD